jgi:hypothetical protein
MKEIMVINLSLVEYVENGNYFLNYVPTLMKNIKIPFVEVDNYIGCDCVYCQTIMREEYNMKNYQRGWSENGNRDGKIK